MRTTTITDNIALAEQGELDRFFCATHKHWTKIARDSFAKKGRRIVERGLYAREDVEQEVLLAAVEAVS